MLIPVHTFAKLVEGSQDPGDSFDTLKARDLAMMLDRLPDRQLASFYAHPNVATHLETLFSEVPTEEELRYFSARSRVEEDERYASGQMKSYLTTPFARDMKGVRTRTTWEGSRSIYEKYKDDPVKNQKFDTMQLRQVVRRQIMDTPEFGATVLSGLVGSIPAEGDPEDLRLPTESRVQPLKLFHALPTATQLKVMDAMGDDELNSFYENIKQTPESLGAFLSLCAKVKPKILESLDGDDPALNNMLTSTVDDIKSLDEGIKAVDAFEMSQIPRNLLFKEKHARKNLLKRVWYYRNKDKHASADQLLEQFDPGFDKHQSLLGKSIRLKELRQERLAQLSTIVRHMAPDEAQTVVDKVNKNDPVDFSVIRSTVTSASPTIELSGLLAKAKKQAVNQHVLPSKLFPKGALNQELCKKFASIGRQDPPLLNSFLVECQGKLDVKDYQKLCQTLAFEMFKGYPTDFISRYETLPKDIQDQCSLDNITQWDKPKVDALPSRAKVQLFGLACGMPSATLGTFNVEDYLPLGIATYLQSHPDAVSPLQDLRDHLFDPSSDLQAPSGPGTATSSTSDDTTTNDDTTTTGSLRRLFTQGVSTVRQSVAGVKKAIGDTVGSWIDYAVNVDDTTGLDVKGMLDSQESIMTLSEGNVIDSARIPNMIRYFEPNAYPANEKGLEALNALATHLEAANIDDKSKEQLKLLVTARGYAILKETNPDAIENLSRPGSETQDPSTDQLMANIKAIYDESFGPSPSDNQPGALASPSATIRSMDQMDRQMQAALQSTFPSPPNARMQFSLGLGLNLGCRPSNVDAMHHQVGRSSLKRAEEMKKSPESLPENPTVFEATYFLDHLDVSLPEMKDKALQTCIQSLDRIQLQFPQLVDHAMTSKIDRVINQYKSFKGDGPPDDDLFNQCSLGMQHQMMHAFDRHTPKLSTLSNVKQSLGVLTMAHESYGQDAHIQSMQIDHAQQVAKDHAMMVAQSMDDVANRTDYLNTLTNSMCDGFKQCDTQPKRSIMLGQLRGIQQAYSMAGIPMPNDVHNALVALILDQPVDALPFSDRSIDHIINLIEGKGVESGDSNVLKAKQAIESFTRKLSPNQFQALQRRMMVHIESGRASDVKKAMAESLHDFRLNYNLIGDRTSRNAIDRNVSTFLSSEYGDLSDTLTSFFNSNALTPEEKGQVMIRLVHESSGRFCQVLDAFNKDEPKSPELINGMANIMTAIANDPKALFECQHMMNTSTDIVHKMPRIPYVSSSSKPMLFKRFEKRDIICNALKSLGQDPPGGHAVSAFIQHMTRPSDVARLMKALGKDTFDTMIQHQTLSEAAIKNMSFSVCEVRDYAVGFQFDPGIKPSDMAQAQEIMLDVVAMLVDACQPGSDLMAPSAGSNTSMPTKLAMDRLHAALTVEPQDRLITITDFSLTYVNYENKVLENMNRQAFNALHNQGILGTFFGSHHQKSSVF